MLPGGVICSKGFSSAIGVAMIQPVNCCVLLVVEGRGSKRPLLLYRRNVFPA
jgi:hypothetical protein